MNEAVRYDYELSEELINGEFIAMSPALTNHNRVSGNIFLIFGSYLKDKSCSPFPDGEFVFLTETDHFVPDCMIVCDRDKIKWNGVHGAPDLVVEVLSPSTAARDRGYKKAVYEASGVPEYWIVNPMDRSVEVYLLTNGHFGLDDIYYMLPPEQMEEEKGKCKTQFKCHLYDDLIIHLEDIFHNLI